MEQLLKPDNVLLSHLANPELNTELPPVMQLQYKFASPFSTVCAALIRRDSWEPRTTLSSVSHVEQLDEDRIVMYRRKE